MERQVRKLTIKEIVEAFGDDIRDVLKEKLRTTTDEYRTLSNRLEQKRTSHKKHLIELLKEEGIPRDSWDLYWLIVHQLCAPELEQQVATLEVELGNIVQAWGFYYLSKHPEADRLPVEEARVMPVQNYYPGELKRRGDLLYGKCPFHDDETPSFYIYPDNHFHCFGCQEHGDVITFIEKLHDLDFIKAVKYLI